jgi:pyruvate formate lyase activating enzyme
MSNRILVTNIQRFSLHDGPGIRTTVFLKGCSIRCPWCSNPECINTHPEDYNNNGIRGVWGKWYCPESLIKECLKDTYYYGNNKSNREDWGITDADSINALPGGVTFSGGECLLQVNELLPVLQSLNKLNIHIAIETSLFAPLSNLLIALEHVDLFYVDVKILNKTKCHEYLHANLSQYLTNLDKLFSWKDINGKAKPIIIRIPIIGTYTDTKDNLILVKELLNSYKDRILKIEILKEHNLAESKYRSINKNIEYHGVSDSFIDFCVDYLQPLGLPITIHSV